jgi:hypothetical protein
MLLHALRRWLARHSAAGVLGLALGLTLVLGGAQLAAVCHEIAHAQASGDTRDLHASGGHECPTCLLAAAIGGAAPAPGAVVLHAPDATLAAPPALAREFRPRFLRVYASRAPPGVPVIAS